MSGEIRAPRSIGDVLSRLQHIRRQGDGWVADCSATPAHKTPAKHLSIKDAGDKALVSCHGNLDHSYQAICESLDFDTLTYVKTGGKKTSRPVAFYNYTDEDDHVVYQVVRMEPKDFRQRRPKAGIIQPHDEMDADWDWTIKGTRHVLFRLSAVHAVIPSGEPVIITEGEKDAINVFDQTGIIATTNAGGAGKWVRKDDNGKEVSVGYEDQLIDADVVIIGDNDKAGTAHVAQVARLLMGKAKRVRVFPLPQTVKDISNWFETGATTQDFFDLLDKAIEQAPDTLPDDGKVKLVWLSDVEPETVEWFWHPRIPVGKLTLIEGDPGEGKTGVALALATSATTGRGLPPNYDSPCPIGNVLYMTAEDGIRDTIVPRLIENGADRHRIAAPDRLFTLDNEGILLLEMWIIETKPILAVIDPLMAFIPTEVDVNKANQVRHVLSRVGHIAEKYQVAILGVRHLTKSPSSKAIYRGIASIDFTAAARSILLAGQDSESGEYGLCHIKGNLGPKGDPIGYALTDNGHGVLHFEWLKSTTITQDKILAGDERASKLSDAKDFLLDILQDGPLPESEIQNRSMEAGIRPSTLQNAKKALQIKSRKESTAGGKKGEGRWLWYIPDPASQKS